MKPVGQLEHDLQREYQRGQALVLNNSYFNYKTKTDRTLRAQFIRYLLINCGQTPLRITRSDAFTHAKDRYLATRILVTGTLDLSYLGGTESNSLPTLVIEYARFENPIDIRYANLSNVSFNGCQFPALRGKYCRINGGITLNWCGGLAEPSTATHLEEFPCSGNLFLYEAGTNDNKTLTIDTSLPVGKTPVPLCVIDLSEGTIQGSITLCGANISAEGIQDFETLEDSADPSQQHAINLRSSHILGELIVRQSVVLGGISLAGASIEENIWFQACRLMEIDHLPDSRLINVQGLSVGNLFVVRNLDPKHRQPYFRENFHSNYFFGTIVGDCLSAGEIWVSSCFWHGSLFAAKLNVTHSLTLGSYREFDSNAPSDGALYLNGTIDIKNANLGKNFEAHNLQQIHSLEEADRNHYREHLSRFTPVEHINRWLTLSAHAIQIQRRAYFSNAHFNNPTNPTPLDKKYSAASIDLWKSTIGTGLRIGPKCEITGSVFLNGSKIGREIVIQTPSISPGPYLKENSRIPVAISFDESVLDGHLKIGNDTKKSRYVALMGALSLTRTQINGTIQLYKLKFDVSQYKRTKNAEEHRVLLSLRDCTCAQEIRVKDMQLVHEPKPIHQEAQTKHTHEQREWLEHLVDPKNKTHFYRLDFYQGVVLARVELRERDEQQQFFHVLIDYPENTITSTFVVNGKSDNIHALNGQLLTRGRFTLDNNDQILNYLRFFCDSIGGAEGPFSIVKGVESEESDGSSHVIPTNQEKSIRPKDAEDTQEETQSTASECKARVYYGANLFDATFKVYKTGMVEMLDDSPVKEGIHKDIRVQYPLRPMQDRFKDVTFEEFLSPDRLLTVDDSEQLINAIKEWITNKNASKTRAAKTYSPNFIDIFSDPKDNKHPDDTRKLLESTVIYDFRGLSAGALNDGHGGAWNIGGSPPVWLRAHGIKVGRVEQPYAPVFDGLTDSFDKTAGSSSNSRTAPAIRSRLLWLTLQARKRKYETSANETENSESKLKCDPKFETETFVPQTFDEFANAHLRAGETEAGQGILIGRKDIKNALRCQDFENSIWPEWNKKEPKPKPNPTNPIMRFGSKIASNLSDLVRDRWRSSIKKQISRTTQSIRSASALARFSDYLPGWKQKLFARLQPSLNRLKSIQSPFSEFLRSRILINPQTLEPRGTPWGHRTLCVLAFAAVSLILGKLTGAENVEHFSAFVLLLGSIFMAFPLFFRLSTWFFKTGFSYGLSPERALITLALFLTIGTVGTHYARTGSLNPAIQWDTTYEAGVLKENVVLVLDVPYEPSLMSTSDTPPEALTRGYTLYADPYPCNQKVSSLLYAMDIFIPLIELGQRTQCSIRPQESEQNSTTLFLWRLAKALYEISGWIVTSLVILTLTGVLRRDIER